MKVYRTVELQKQSLKRITKKFLVSLMTTKERLLTYKNTCNRAIQCRIFKSNNSIPV